jgi:hypothetical protein
MRLRGRAAIYAGAEIALRVHFFRAGGRNVGAGIWNLRLRAGLRHAER